MDHGFGAMGWDVCHGMGRVSWDGAWLDGMGLAAFTLGRYRLT